MTCPHCGETVAHKAWCPLAVKQRFARRESGTAVRSIIRACDRYAKAYADLYSGVIGNDGVLGPPFREILSGAIQLLNGEIGGLDGGTLDREIRRIALEAGLDGDTL